MFSLPRLFVVCITLLLAPGLSAQSIFERAKRAAERGATRAVEREADRRADRAVSGAIACALGDAVCAREAEAEGQEVVYVDANGEPVEDQAAAAQATQGAAPDTTARPGTGIWANYDFVPGDRVLYVHDFEGTRTGNFPSRLDYIAGTLDVVELTEGDAENNVLRIGEGTSEGGPGGTGCFTIPLPETLPERYTMQFRVRTSDPLRRASLTLFSDGSDDTPDTRCNYPPNPHVLIGKDEQGLQLPGGYGAGKATGNVGFQPDTWYDVAIAVDGPYWKMYVNGERVANVPRYDFPRAEKLHVFLNVYRYSLFVDDLRIAEGGPRSLYDDLEADGFVSTTGILFDTGSARIKPESTPTLNEVLDMLEDHDDLSLVIEGHTDSDGGDASNQTLSENRAAAVKAYLVDNGIDAGRLDTVGRGESEPVADNGTPEGKAQNRRVVFRRAE